MRPSTAGWGGTCCCREAPQADMKARGETDLATILGSLNPRMMDAEYVVCCLDRWRWCDLEKLAPLALFREEEALTVVVERHRADAAGLGGGPVFRGITLSPHSSLEAVGLTAAVASALARRGIPANVFAGYYHDHILVPLDRSEEALETLRGLTG